MDHPQDKTEATATPAPTLAEHVEKTIDGWWGTLMESVGPLVNTQAYNALSTGRDNLKKQLAAAMR
jgi:hypothetical protein